MFSMKNLVRSATAAALVGGVTLANAAPITAPAELADAGASVLVIGAAVFAISIGIKVYKWVRRAL